MKRLYVFDMDGTLLPHTTAMIEIAKITGHSTELAHLEQKFTARQISGKLFSHELFKIWKKKLSPELIQEAFVKAPKLNNIQTVLQKIAVQGGISCLVTCSQDFFAQHFYDYGFDFIYASTGFNFHTHKFNSFQSLEADDKLQITKQLCRKLNLSFAETAAFGDSISDVPLFKNLSHTVSINGDHHIKEIASHHYNGLDLLQAFSKVSQ